MNYKTIRNAFSVFVVALSSCWLLFRGDDDHQNSKSNDKQGRVEPATRPEAITRIEPVQDTSRETYIDNLKVRLNTYSANPSEVGKAQFNLLSQLIDILETNPKIRVSDTAQAASRIDMIDKMGEPNLGLSIRDAEDSLRKLSDPSSKSR